MARDVIEIATVLPDKEERKRLAAFSSQKPMASVSLSLDNGACREIVVPERVGKLMVKGEFSLPLPEEEAFDAIHELEYRVCLAQLTDMLSRRDHSIGELVSKLKAYGYRDAEVDRALRSAEEKRYVDDARFTATFIQQRIARGWGRRKIELELRRRSIDVGEIDGYPDAFFNEEDDLSRAIAVLEKKRIPDDRAREKLTRVLVSRGFSYQVARAAVSKRLEPDETF